MKYKIVGDFFPIEIHFYRSTYEVGDVEIYRTGKIYFKDVPIKSGMSIKDIKKILKIANKERIKLIIKQKLFIRQVK